MAEVHLISWTGARAISRLRTYRAVLKGVLAVDALLGAFALVLPSTFAYFLNQPAPHPVAWPSLWGALTLAVCVFWRAGMRRPVADRWPNWTGIATKILLGATLVFAGRGFLVLALWHGVGGVALFILFYRMLIAEMGRRP